LGPLEKLAASESFQNFKAIPTQHSLERLQKSPKDLQRNYVGDEEDKCKHVQILCMLAGFSGRLVGSIAIIECVFSVKDVKDFSIYHMFGEKWNLFRKLSPNMDIFDVSATCCKQI